MFDPWVGKIPLAAEQLSMCSTATELHALEPELRNREITEVRNLSTTPKRSPHSQQREKVLKQNKDAMQPKVA